LGQEPLADDGSHGIHILRQQLEGASIDGMDFTLPVMRELFFAPLQLDSSVFLTASRAQVRKYYIKRLSEGVHGDSFKSGGWKMVSAKHVICPSARVHLDECKKLHKLGRLGRDLVSLSQSPLHHVFIKPSGCAPTLTRNSLLYSMLGRRLLLPAETLQMQGLPVPAMLPKSGLASRWPFACDLPDIMSESWERSVAGNGMHMCQVGSAVLLALAVLA
jgi:hypothetical protein